MIRLIDSYIVITGEIVSEGNGKSLKVSCQENLSLEPFGIGVNCRSHDIIWHA